MSDKLGLARPEAMKWLEENMIPYYPLGNFSHAKGGKIIWRQKK